MIIQVIKQRTMWWAEHVTRMGRVAYQILWENLTEKDHFEDAGIGVTLILQWIFKQLDGEAWTGWI